MKERKNLISMIEGVLSNENNRQKISELHCQKILFFCYGLFYKRFKKLLFKAPDFRAWKFGVIEMNYRLYFHQKDESLLSKFNLSLSQKELAYLNDLIKIFANQSPWSLVELSHIAYAWYANYNVNESKVSLSDVLRTFDSFSLN